jgi:hypothetical protein
MLSGLLFDGATLSQADVSELKQAVDTFAANYTSGTDATADKAAVSALNSSLDDLALGLWSEAHVASSASVAQLQQAVDGFAKSYTGGSNLATDKAAWKALGDGLHTFASALQGGQSSASGGSGVLSADSPGLGVAPMIARMPGNGFAMLVSGLLQGPALTKDEVSSLQQAVDTFETSYTEGADATKDQNAVDALQTSLDNVAESHWSVPPDTSGGAPTILPAIQGASGSSTATTSGVSNASTTSTTTATPVMAPNIATALKTTPTGSGTSGTANGLPNGTG